MAVQTRLIYEFDEFQLDPEQRKLRRRGQVMPLHGKAFEMLLVLIRNRGRLLTKDELFQLVWPDQIVEESNLTVNMSAIRRALGERASNPRYITTISGRGYRFNGEVRQFADEALMIERETFARVTVEQEETESRVAVFPSVSQIAKTLHRITSHPVLLMGLCGLVLAIAGVWLGWRRGYQLVLPVVLILYIPATIAFVLTNMRYTTTVQPLLLIFVAVTLVAAADRSATRRRGKTG